MNTPNSVEQAFDNAPATELTVDAPVDGTVVTPEAEPVIDYKEKFGASSKEALRLLEENKAKDAEIERLSNLSRVEAPDEGNSSQNLYPGFDQLSEEDQKNLIDFARGVEHRVKQSFDNDPAISFARNNYNEKKFDDALNAAIVEFPDLATSKDEFKSKFFNPKNVPDNIDKLVVDLAKVHLYDTARQAGAEEERAKQDRIDTERVRGGSNGAAPAQTSRSLSEWHQIAQENPAKFAAMKKEYEADLATGKLAE